MNYISGSFTPYMVEAGGNRTWWLGYVLHRTDGPAVQYDSGSKEWWLNGVRYTEEQFNEYNAKDSTILKNVISMRIELNTDTIFDIMGKKYKLVETV